MHQPAPPSRVLFYDDPLFREHDPGVGHPERAERLDAVRRGLVAAGLEPRLLPGIPRPATTEDLLRVHTEEHVANVAKTRGHQHQFDPDTTAGPRSYEAALLAAGSVVDAVERVVAGEADRAFCAVRPPGHHAEADRAMGFCLFNNVAVGAAHALARGLSRVLIVDWDVHHGNGTQAIFYDDPRVLYVSSHAYPFYPGTGALDEMGEGAGTGFTVNLPLPNGTGDRQYARLYRELVAPIANAYAPELVLVSVGFDPHALDPLAGMSLTERGFAELTDVCLGVAEWSSQGRAVFVLEGGYDLGAISASSAAVVQRLLGDPYERLVPATGGRFDEEVALMRRDLARHWPVLA
jgi:acetoin utilization deacetylase AcuC-like enzyme